MTRNYSSLDLTVPLTKTPKNPAENLYSATSSIKTSFHH